jgi:hypothetical protein
MIRLRNAVVIPVAALAFAGCGGEDKPTKAEFIKSADKVCKDLDKKTDGLTQSEPDNAQEIAQLARDLKKTAQGAVKDVRALEVPEGADGDKAKEWQAAVTAEAENQLIPAVDELEKAAEANDAKAIVAAAQKMQELEATRSDKLAKEIGLKECGNES